MKDTWWTYSEIEQCKNMYAEDKTVKDIAIALDRAETSVLSLLVTERVIKTIN